MSANTKIEWCDRTWNVVTGCTKVSQGCKHCYAEGVADRFWGHQYPMVPVGPTLPDGGPTAWRERQFTDVQAHENRLLEPLRWRKPARVFVNSMSDLFHEAVPDAFVDRVFAVMALASQHSFLVLTKRPERMKTYLTSRAADFQPIEDAGCEVDEDLGEMLYKRFPAPNVWLGVSAEDQATADARIPLLLETPAAIRFVSYEPALGPVDFRNMLGGGECDDCGQTLRVRDGQQHCGCEESPQPVDLGLCPPNDLDWIIVGGESGTGARPFDVAWARKTVEQCRAASVPVFVKQLGANVRDRNDAGFTGDEPHHWPEIHAADDRIEHDLDGTRDGYQGAPVRIHLKSRKGGDMQEFPEDLRVREFPAEVRG